MKQLPTSHIFSEEQTRFERYLAGHGRKASRGRKEVFKEVFNHHGHFTAEEVVKSCRKNKLKASRATIYRSLRELLEAGIVRKTAFGEKHDCFEHVYDEELHHHARCIRCRALVEFPDLKEDRVYISLLKKKNFHILGHEMHFYGICKNCQHKEKM